MNLIILFLPFAGAFISGFLGRFVGTTGAQILTCACILTSALLSLYYWLSINELIIGLFSFEGDQVYFTDWNFLSNNTFINLGTWVDSEYIKISWEFTFNEITLPFLFTVLFISFLIHLFSVNYMANDPHIQRFFSYLSLFTFFMAILVTGANYFVLFVGWEGIGVVSYLLINFWFTRIQANKAAILAFNTNRIGDMALSIAYFVMLPAFGSADFSTVFSLPAYINQTTITIIGFLLLVGAMAKSSQIPLHNWLPGSMEGPTPVSALIHAATLVTAGSYLLIRSSPLLEYAPTVLLVITIIGASTAFFAATCGLVQNDIKRIIAFSTISQLGYMVMAIGLSQYNVALAHTLFHAYFKALLFLGAGSVIHAFGDIQDVRKMGGLINFLPFTYAVMLVGTLSLLATPFLTGFYSKDLIIELAYGQYSFSGTYAYILGSVTAGLTAFYSFRLISLVFLTKPNGNKQNYLNSHEASITVIIPLAVLAIFSIFFGYVTSDLFVGIGSDFFANTIFIHPNNISLVEAEFSMNLIFKLLPTIFSLAGTLFALYLYNYNPHFIDSLVENNLGKKVYGFLNGKYYFDVIYNNYIISKGLQFGYNISKEIDRGVIELIGPYGMSNVLYSTSANIAKLDTGIITTYALYITLGLLSLLFIVFAPMLVNTTINDEFRLIILFIFTLIVNSAYLNKKLSNK